jgi:hypothetical protein
MNKKVLIGSFGVIAAAAIIGVVAAIVIKKKKDAAAIKAGDLVSFSFASATLEPVVCAKIGDALVLSGKVDSVDAAAKTAKVVWDTLKNPNASDNAAVPDAKCVSGSILTLNSTENAADTTWVATWFGAAGVAPSQKALAAVPALLPLDKLVKL